jgi:hypothetical protein
VKETRQEELSFRKNATITMYRLKPRIRVVLSGKIARQKTSFFQAPAASPPRRA